MHKKKLEKSKLTSKGSSEIVKLRLQLQNIPGDKDHKICLKMEDALKKNQEYQILFNIQKVPSGDEDGHLPINYSSKFSPITSVDAKRSFSLYKHVRNKRLSLNNRLRILKPLISNKHTFYSTVTIFSRTVFEILNDKFFTIEETYFYSFVAKMSIKKYYK
jgi:hypothetical protein